MGNFKADTGLSYILKIVSAAILQVYFLSLKESTCETTKMFFISLQKFLLFSKTKQNFKYPNFMTSLNVYTQEKKYILLNNLGITHSLLMKFGQVVPSVPSIPIPVYVLGVGL